MKKVMILSICGLLGSFQGFAGNFVPVCAGVLAEHKSAVYNAIVENSFVTQLDLSRAEKLSDEDKNYLVNNERAYVKRKIHEAVLNNNDQPSDNNLPKVSFISKSLYQLFVWYSYLKDTTADTKLIEEYEYLFLVNERNKRNKWLRSTFANGIGFGNIKHAPKDISEFCNDYMRNSDVMVYYWSINNDIVSFISEISKNQEPELKDIIQALLQELSTKIEKFRISLDDIGMFDVNVRLPRLVEHPNESFVNTVTDLIVEESKAPENTYRIYRSEGFVCPDQTSGSSRSSEISYSFSDGMFGGIIRDYTGAMAFNIGLGSKHMKIIDIPKEDLLNNANDSVVIPPVISMGAALGYGEFHHVRTKVTGEQVSGLNGLNGTATVCKDINKWLFCEHSAVTNFWNKLELNKSVTYTIPYDGVDYKFNVQNFRLKSGRDDV